MVVLFNEYDTEKSCEGDNEQACFFYGSMLYYGDGCPKDEKKAIPLFERSCFNNNHTDSCFLAGQTYIRQHADGESSSVPREPAKAIPFFEQGCKLNQLQSCRNLAVMYKNGDEGVPKDEAKFNHFKDETMRLFKIESDERNGKA